MVLLHVGNTTWKQELEIYGYKIVQCNCFIKKKDTNNEICTMVKKGKSFALEMFKNSDAVCKKQMSKTLQNCSNTKQF